MESGGEAAIEDGERRAFRVSREVVRPDAEDVSQQGGQTERGRRRQSGGGARRAVRRVSSRLQFLVGVGNFVFALRVRVRLLQQGLQERLVLVADFR